MKAIIFYSLTEAELDDRRLLQRGLDDVASRGFDGIYLEYRNIRSGHTGARFRRGVRAACRYARDRGLGVVVDAHYGGMAHAIRAEAPEVFSDSWLPQRVRVRDGRFTIAFADETQYRAVERCWAMQPAPGGKTWRFRDVTARVRLRDAIADGGGCAMTEVKGRAVARLSYEVSGMTNGELLVVLRRRCEYGAIDLSHPRLRAYVRRRLDSYRGLPLSGVAWDEPHFGFAFWREDGRAISGSLLRLFRRRFGYDLCERMTDLWFDRPGGGAALTRLHYAELLEQCLADLEADFERQARRRLKARDDAFIGIHRTMHEETGDDFLIGCCDYFRHNRHTLGAFTDSVFEREDSMVTLLQLARSMAVAKGEPAWNNSWGFVPTEAHHAYYLRLMGAMQVRWIGHTYHSSHQFGPGYPDHPLWATLRPHLAAHRRLLDALEGATPATDTAVLYNWRAMAAFAGNYLHVHRRNLLLLGKALTEAQIQFRLVDDEALKHGTTWRRVIVPWPDMLPSATMTRLEQLAAAGTDILMFGPPAAMDADGGSQSRAFARLCGIAPPRPGAARTMREGERIRWNRRPWRLDPTGIEPGYRSNEQSSYPEDFKAYVLDPRPATEAIATWRGRPVAVRRGRVSYFAVELAHFAGLPAALLGGEAVAEISNGWRLFAYRRGDADLLAGVSHGGTPRRAALKWLGSELSLDDCACFVAARVGSRLDVLMREDGGKRE
jgi:hypothetical protein